MNVDDNFSLLVNGRVLQGWESVRVTRSIERFPSDFELQMTERFPGTVGRFVTTPGDSCQIALGDDLVLTGYVDGFRPSLSPSSHQIQVFGRSKCSDLVDASAEWPGGQIVHVSVFEIAHQLAFAFGIDVEGIPEDDAFPIPQYNLAFGESAYDVIERMCRFRGLMAYDTPEGKLRLARAAFIKAETSLVEGKNVQSCSAEYRMDGRFSEYVIVGQSRQMFSDVGEASFMLASAKDAGVKRHRPKYIVAEASESGYKQAQVRAYWEYLRRAGRSAQVQVTVDSWRDGAGLLWEPNTLVGLDLPSMKLVDKHWLIVDVTYRRDEQNGTACDLLLMPPEAFTPQPPSFPNFADIRKALAGTPLGDDRKVPENVPGASSVENLPKSIRDELGGAN